MSGYDNHAISINQLDLLASMDDSISTNYGSSTNGSSNYFVIMEKMRDGVFVSFDTTHNSIHDLGDSTYCNTSGNS